MYYDKQAIEPLIYTQSLEEQNNFLLCPFDFIYSRNNLQQLLFSQVDKKGLKDSFFRICFFQKKILILYYWETTITEAKSNRSGLFSILGVAFDSHLIKWPKSIMCIVVRFFKLIEYTFHININATNCDKLYPLLQQDINTELIFIYNNFIKEFWDYFRCYPTKKYLFQRLNAYRKNKFLNIIFFKEPDFYTKLSVFIKEVLYTYPLAQFLDVSTLRGISPLTVKLSTNEQKELSILPCFETRTFAKIPYALIK